MPSPHRHRRSQIQLSSILLAVAGTAVAQTPADTPVRPATESARPAAPTRLQYVSPLRTYKAYADQPVESWREANDRVGRIGGWRAYAKEAQSGEAAKESAAPTPSAAPAAPAASAPDPHAGHHGGAKR